VVKKKMKRKREHVLDNPSKKNKTDKIIDEIKTKKLLIKDFTQNPNRVQKTWCF